MSWRLGLAGWLAAERDRWPLWLPVALGAGAALYFALGTEPPPALAWGAGGAALLLALAGRRHFVFALAAALLLGFAAAKLRETRMAAPVLDRRLTTHLSARIAGIETSDTGLRLTLAQPVSGAFAAAPRALRVSVRGRGAELMPGHWISLTARLAPPAPPSEPGADDFARAAFFDGVGGSGFAFGYPAPQMSPGSPGWGARLSDAVAALRWRTTLRIRAALPGSEGAIAAALITGMRGGIAQDDVAALRDAGLAHVLAIAGLHMALMGMGLFWLARAGLALSPRLALQYPIKKWAALAALAGAGFYLLLSGAAAPAVRAFTMLAVGLVAILSDRPALSMRGLGLAAAILLLLRPESITEPGFQMSFAAVAALIAVAESSRASGGGIRGHLIAIFVTSAVASLATLPFAIFHFGRATHYAALGNLLAMPVMGLVVMPLASLSVAAMPFGLEAGPLHLLGHGIDLMLWLGRLVAHLPGAATSASAMPVTALALMALGGLWIVLWRRDRRWLGLLGVAAGIVVAAMARPPDLLIGADAATVALRGADGRLHLIGRPLDRFSAQDWLRRDGDARDLKDAIGLPGLTCDGEGCVAATTAGLLAVSRRPESLAEDCAHAALLVSAAPVSCKAPRFVTDGPRAAHDQGYAIWFTPAWKVETVRAWRGERPWVR